MGNASMHKPFVHRPLSVGPCKREEKDGKRFYRTPTGGLYPSVTTFLGAMEEDTEWYDKWAKSLGGYDKAEAESNRCADRGTGVHLSLEKMLANEDGYIVHSGQYQQMFRQLERPLRENLSEVWCSETMLYSDKLKIAGTVDCAGIYKGLNSVIDFKTSNNVKKEEHILDYFLQSTCYALMLEEHFKIEIPQIVIAICIENETRPQIIEKMKSQYLKPLAERLKKFHAMEAFYPKEDPMAAFWA